MTRSHVFASFILLVPAVSACSTDTSDSVFRNAAMESVEDARAHYHKVALPRLLQGVDLSRDASAIAESLVAAVRAHSPCANVSQPSAESVAVEFPEDGSCTFGRREHSVHGTMQLTIAAGDEASVEGELSLFGDHDVEIDGTMTLRLVDGIQYGESTVELQRGSLTRTMAAEWTEQAVENEGVSGWAIDGNRSADSCMGTRERTMSDLFVVEGEVVPSEGTITGDGPGGGTMTKTFERVDDDTIHIKLSIEAPTSASREALREARRECAEQFGRAEGRRSRRRGLAGPGGRGAKGRFDGGDRTIAVTPDGEFIEML